MHQNDQPTADAEQAALNRRLSSMFQDYGNLCATLMGYSLDEFRSHPVIRFFHQEPEGFNVGKALWVMAEYSGSQPVTDKDIIDSPINIFHITIYHIAICIKKDADRALEALEKLKEDNIEMIKKAKASPKGEGHA